MRILLFSQNFENFNEGAYHNDLVLAVKDISESYVYGPGYKDYDINDNLSDVLSKANWLLKDIDYIITGTSWDKYVQYNKGNPHHRIDFSTVEGPITIHFLQNEYKDVDIKLKYVEEQRFDYVVSAYETGTYDEWSKETGIKVIYSKLAINLKVFRDYRKKRRYDFMFTGELHKQYLPDRYSVKKELFSRTQLVGGYEIKSNIGFYRLLSIINPIKRKYRKYKIYWAERHRFSVSILGRTLTPHGEQYVRLLNSAKVSLCTFSANRQFGLRFYELMSTGTLILCPKDDYDGILEDGKNCIMFAKDMSDFEEKLAIAIDNDDYRNMITENAKKEAMNQDYQHRLYDVFREIEEDNEKKTN